jgi:hypothetical protein
MTVPVAQALFHTSTPPAVSAKHPNGTPAQAEPPAKMSGYAPRSTLVIMAPEDVPMENTRLGSAL